MRALLNAYPEDHFKMVMQEVIGEFIINNEAKARLKSEVQEAVYSCSKKLTNKINEFQKKLGWVDDVVKRDRAELAEERLIQENELSRI